jgi:hypothetical protein
MPWPARATRSCVSHQRGCRGVIDNWPYCRTVMSDPPADPIALTTSMQSLWALHCWGYPALDTAQSGDHARTVWRASISAILPPWTGGGRMLVIEDCQGCRVEPLGQMALVSPLTLYRVRSFEHEQRSRDAGSQTGSQQWPIPGDARLRPATVGTAQWHIGSHPAPQLATSGECHLSSRSRVRVALGSRFLILDAPGMIRTCVDRTRGSECDDVDEDDAFR